MKSEKFHIISIIFAITSLIPVVSYFLGKTFFPEPITTFIGALEAIIILIGGFISPIFIAISILFFVIALYLLIKSKTKPNKLLIANTITTISLVLSSWWAWLVFHIR